MNDGAQPGGFEVWYRREHPRLVTLLTVITGEADLSAEAVDEALARTLERWERVSQMESPAAFAYQVALNVARRRARRRDLERRLWARRRPEQVPGPTGELWLLVADLAPRQRAAVLLRHVAQLREQEIAEVMGVARGTVSATLRAAYEHLAAAIDDDEPSQGAVRHG